MKSRIRRIVMLCAALIMLAIACITFIAENIAADEAVQSEIVSSTDDIKAQESVSTTVETSSMTESKTEVTSAVTSKTTVTSVKTASKTTASTAKSTMNTSKSNSSTTKKTTTTKLTATTTMKTTSTTKLTEVTVQTTSSTSKASITTTTTNTTQKPTTATTTAKATAVWGSVDKMKSDCRAIAADCGFTWDSSLNKSNSHWITPTYTGAFSSASTLKAKIRDFLESYSYDGYDTVNIIFESAGNGEYYLYYCVG